MTSRTTRIPSLDGYRGFFCIVVFLAHVKMAWLDDWLGKGSNWYFGNLGVTCFFFISGYIITTLLRIEYEQHGSISLRNFFIRRAYRLLPPFYIVLTLDILLTAGGLLDGPLAWNGVLLQALHLSNYLEAVNPGENVLVPGTGIMWSLAVEEHFYLLFPAFLLLVQRRFDRHSIAMMMLTGCLVVLCWRAYLYFGAGMHQGYFRIATDTRIDSILAGCVMGLVANPALDAPVLQGRWWRPVFLVASTVVLVAGTFVQHPAFTTTLMYTAQALAFYAIIGYAVRFPELWCFRWLNWRPLTWLGLISYTFYLIHLPVLKLLNLYVPLEASSKALAAFAISVLFSVAMYHLVETPLTRHARRFR